MIKTERKETTKTFFSYIPVSGICDVCGKELIQVDENKLPRFFRDHDVYDYYRIATYHHDWGNDSIDSYEYFDCCCLDCALQFIRNYWNGRAEKDPFTTSELEIKHMTKLEEP